MRRTLSHRILAPASDPTVRRPARPVGTLLVGLVLMALALAGCNRVDGDPTEDGATGRAAAEDTGSDSATAPFRWPEDPSHPVLELAVETPDATGTIRIELMPELAPATVISVLELAEQGFYDGTTFHRVIPGFMIQGGDPNSRDRDPSNDGRGRHGPKLLDEFGGAPFERGVVGMGNRGRENSTSTQFFIMHADNRSLDGRYTAIGRVIEGMELVDDITKVAIDRTGRWGPKDRPIENVVMKRVRPIGQLAAIMQAKELEAAADDDTRNAASFAGHDGGDATGGAGTSGGPAALGDDDDWERLEAMGR